jgi:flagellin-like hook-associated protein FlgL
MSGITLSASVRQNLLSLQSTADLLSTTQNRLATGNKVNSALDNPTNFFTAQGLNNRAGDINNLLDGIGNGVQILQAANTGITSLQKLVDSAKSIANQALQATSGYSTKSQATATITGATADNLLGTPDVAATLTGSAAGTLATGGALTGATGGSFVAGDSFSVNGTTIKVVALGTTVNANTTDTDGSILLNTTATAPATSTDMTDAIKTALGGGSAAASITASKVTLTGANGTDSIVLGGSASVLAKLGLTAGTTAATSSHVGETLKIGALDGSAAQTITFGTGAGQVKTLDDLNKKLADSNLQASIDDKTGKLTITTTNDEASFDFTKGTSIFSGTAAASGKLFGAALSLSGPVADVNAQNTRAGLVAQYNTVIDQIKTTANDASFNGVNLLNGDTLALTFNETGKSKLSITGVTFDPSGLGLASLTKGTDFLDNAATNKLLTGLNNASSKLRSQASAFGSNLSVVQMRQDFSKQMINVLQTGASSLTLADTNEEAANSQALSTRQSIAVSALSLANQSQQGVLQLLR